MSHFKEEEVTEAGDMEAEVTEEVDMADMAAEDMVEADMAEEGMEDLAEVGTVDMAEEDTADTVVEVSGEGTEISVQVTEVSAGAAMEDLEDMGLDMELADITVDVEAEGSVATEATVEAAVMSMRDSIINHYD